MTSYFHTSALAKLVIREPESLALTEWLTQQDDQFIVTNSVGAVELHRTIFRVSAAAAGEALRLLARVDELELTSSTLHLAARLPPPSVRTLDALHIASGAQVRDLAAFVTYDHRMAAAAIDFGLPVVSPGAE